MDDQNLYRGTEVPSIEDLSLSGSIHPGRFRLPRYEPATTIAPLNFTLRGNSTFRLFSPRRANSDLTSREKPSTNPSTKRSTLSSAREFKLTRHIFTGDTFSPLTTLSFKRLQREGQSSSETKLNGTEQTKTSKHTNTDQKKAKKCFELMDNRLSMIILGSVLLFVALSAIALSLGLGIYFGVIVKSQEALTNTTPRSSSNTTFNSTEFTNFTYSTTQLDNFSVDGHRSSTTNHPSDSTANNFNNFTNQSAINQSTVNQSAINQTTAISTPTGYSQSITQSLQTGSSQTTPVVTETTTNNNI